MAGDSFPRWFHRPHGVPYGSRLPEGMIGAGPRAPGMNYLTAYEAGRFPRSGRDGRGLNSLLPEEVARSIRIRPVQRKNPA